MRFPDIITGYNIDGYDLPLLVERAELHGIDLAIGRNGSILEQRFQRFWQAKGRVIVDAWWNVVNWDYVVNRFSEISG